VVRSRRFGPAARPLALVGPTASGKTETSVELARRLGAEILLVDSMTIYRGMDVGTAKPSPEQRRVVPHHLIDVAEPSEAFSVARFQTLAGEALAAIRRRGRRPLLVGGSGLYFRAVGDGLTFPGRDPEVRRDLEVESAAVGAGGLHARLAGLDPAAAAKIEPANVRRTARALEVIAITGRPFSSFAADWDQYPAGRVRAAGVALRPEVLRARIERRVEAMFRGGLVSEVESLLERGFGTFVTSTQAIGYLEVAEHLAGRLTLEEAAEWTAKRTRALARRQMAWFRKDPRIRWFQAGEGGAVEVVDEIEEWLRT
jgi:tRNA dimethylallyltransferase